MEERASFCLLSPACPAGAHLIQQVIWGAGVIVSERKNGFWLVWFVEVPSVTPRGDQLGEDSSEGNVRKYPTLAGETLLSHCAFWSGSSDPCRPLHRSVQAGFLWLHLGRGLGLTQMEVENLEPQSVSLHFPVRRSVVNVCGPMCHTGAESVRTRMMLKTRVDIHAVVGGHRDESQTSTTPHHRFS